MAPYTSPLAEALAPDLLERFDRYVRIDTQSAARPRRRARARPGQLELGRAARRASCRTIGLDDAALDDNGYVTATLPATGERRRRPSSG